MERKVGREGRRTTEREMEGERLRDRVRDKERAVCTNICVFQESFFFFHHVVLGIKHKLSGLVTRTFIH